MNTSLHRITGGQSGINSQHEGASGTRRFFAKNISRSFTNEFLHALLAANEEAGRDDFSPIDDEIIMDPTIYKLINGPLLVPDQKFRRLPIKSLTNDGARSSLALLCNA